MRFEDFKKVELESTSQITGGADCFTGKGSFEGTTVQGRTYRRTWTSDTKTACGGLVYHGHTFTWLN